MYTYSRYYILTFFITFFICLIGSSQNEAANWFLTEDSGLYFTSNSVQVQNRPSVEHNLPTSYNPPPTYFGAPSTMSNSDGDLLFYVENNIVYNRFHQEMLNGNLRNDEELRHSGESIIIPYPGNPFLFYVFYKNKVTTGFTSYNDELLYCIVNIRANAGLGDVTTIKDIKLLDNTAIDLEAVFHSNGSDVWLLTIDSNTDVLKSFRIDSNGLNTTPVQSFPIVTYLTPPEIKRMVISPNGKKLVYTSSGTNFSSTGGQSLYLLDYNPSTGLFSNERLLYDQVLDDTYFFPARMVFNPQSTHLMINAIIPRNGGFGFYRLDMRSGDRNSIRNTITRLSGNFAGRNLQYGIDGKLYYLSNGFPELDEFGLPNVDYFVNRVKVFSRLGEFGSREPFYNTCFDLGDKKSIIYFPNFIKSYFIKTFSFENVCNDNSIEFKANLTDQFDTFTWDLGDGNTSNLENPSHLYSSIGDFLVTLNATSSSTGERFTETQKVTVYNQLIAFPVDDLLLCDQSNDGVESFNLLNQINLIMNGQAIETLRVDFFASQEDFELNHRIQSPFNYENISNPQEIVARIGVECGGDCTDLTTFTIGVLEVPVNPLEPVYYLCDNEVLNLEVPGDYSEYLWSTGETSSSITLNSLGDYNLTVRNIEDGLICTETFDFEVKQILSLRSLEVRDFTQNDNSITIIVDGDSEYEYSIDGVNFQSSNTFTGLPIDEYRVFARDLDRCSTVFQDVVMLYYPRFFTPNGDNFNDYWQIKNGRFEPGNKVFIYDRYGKLLVSFNTDSIGWDGTVNGNPLPSSDYWFSLIRQDGSTFKSHFTLKR